MSPRTTVALLFGGRSSEHGISCVTAGGVLSALDPARFDVVAVGVTRQGRCVEVSSDPEHWQIRDGRAPEVPVDGDEVLLPLEAVPHGGRTELRVVRDGRVEHLADVDVVFPLLHGPFGEDGTVQGLLDLADIPYVGSGVLASALCMDKAATKQALQAAGIAVAPGELVTAAQWVTDPDAVRTRLETLPLPWFVKPTRAGSSMGVTRVHTPDGLEEAMRIAVAEDPRVLVETEVEGREIECGVLEGRDGEAPRTTAPGEVILGDDLDFYDYESKYFGKGTVTIQVPAELTPEQSDRVRQVAAEAFTALRLEGLARVDVFVTRQGEVVVNEVNTMPGFTPFSMFPVLWENMGLTYSDLVAELIELARSRPVGPR
ncbi:D-alanine--D-alanine ligase [Brachybacterium sp. EF45031]|uniref:D-alanine--D-alanine ligase family protein n=1 Tax=Brachybacterium sillae TaxID=2810536 RepID=UPI00217E4A7C|nr:D-alanine--D-alanine ligase family protein [Brachybacterium sillae]MCS6710850.1 D-alanine--D-alanine ligase [Brachybacterium sillae]